MKLNGKIYPWLVVAMLWGVALLNYMDRQMLSTMREAMQTDITELESAINFGKLMAIFLWVYGCFSPFAGAIADRINRKSLIVGSLFIWSMVTLLISYSTDYTQIYWLRGIMGLSEALYIPAGLSLIADYHSGRTRGLAVGIHMTGLYFGQAAGGFGAAIASAFSWQQTFFSFGLIGILYAVILLLFLHEKRTEKVEKAEASANKPSAFPFFKSFAMLLTNLVFWVILFYFTAFSLPGWATKNWLPTLFADNLQIPMESAGPIATITIAASSFLGVILGGALSDRWVKRNIKGRVYTGAIGLGLTIPALLLLGLGSDLVSAISAAICFGIGVGFFDANNMPILCQFIPTRLRATAYGILNFAGITAGALVTQLLGKLNEMGLMGSGFVWMSLLMAAATLLQLFVLNPKTDNME